MRASSVAAVAAGTLGALAIGPTVKLRHDEVVIPVESSLLIQTLRERFVDSPDEILAIQDDRMVRRFSGQAGPFPYRTVELVTFGPDWITFEHLSGPFSRCRERFEFLSHSGSTTMTHTGEFRLKGGLWTALLAYGPVRRAFESHVRQHMLALADEPSV